MRQMTHLIDDLLDVSRITRNKLDLRRQRIDIEQVVQVALETSRPLIEAGGHQLTVGLPEQPLHLDGDLTRLAQAISNLLNNAAKYSERGGHITLTARRQGSDAVVCVRDTGIGIAPEMLPRIFDMFTQADGASGRSQGGLGIGLTLVKRLVEMHGGSIHAKSDGPAKGSEFTVRLPIISDKPGESPPNASREHVAKGPALRVLVADDNRDSANCLGMLLRIAGNEVRTAYDGVQAVESAAEFRPEVLLLDVGMPGMNGYDAARHVRNQPWGRSAVLIAVTGWGQDGDREQSKDAGFDHHMVKPVDPGALLQLLGTLKPA
jgi:CheY-like chemotaxis protein